MSSNRFQPLNPETNMSDLVNQINRNFKSLDAETYTKQIKNADKDAILFGQLPGGIYGLLLYDVNGIPNILIGQSPDDKRMGIWVAKPGQNVLTLLGG